MKRKQLIRHIKKYDGFLLREGRRHSIYQRGRLKTEVPRHNEIVDELARKICKDLRRFNKAVKLAVWPQD